MSNAAAIDRSLRSFNIVMESFGSVAMDQEPSDRMNYRTMAMEAVSGPDSGMVMERLYKSIMSRSTTNFGKIPDSEGDLSRFVKYKSIVESFELLDRQFGGTNVAELKIAHDLHTNLLRCRDDFVYGFRMDSQFLKTTYNTMVYSLCEILNLCGVIYVDMLKAIADGKTFTYQPYSDLLLVQNIEKFNLMVTSGEWAQLTLKIRKDPSSFIGAAGGYDGSFWQFLFGAGATGAFGISGRWVVKEAAKHSSVTAAVKSIGAATVKVFTGSLAGQIAGVIIILVALLLIIRGLIVLYYNAAYKLHEILDDNAKILQANAGSENPVSDPETARALYEKLANMRDKINNAILRDNAKGKKKVQDANKDELKPSNMKAAPTAANNDDDGVSFG